MFIAKAVVIILCDCQFSLINQLLSFQRRVEFFILTTPLTLSGPAFSVVRQARAGGGGGLRGPDVKNQG